MRFLHVGHARFNASRTGGRCSPLPSRQHGTRVRDLGAGIGRELVACSFVVERCGSPSTAFWKYLLLSFSMTKACVNTSGTSTAKGASVLFFGSHWSFGAIRERSAVAGTPALYASNTRSLLPDDFLIEVVISTSARFWRASTELRPYRSISRWSTSPLIYVATECPQPPSKQP